MKYRREKPKELAKKVGFFLSIARHSTQITEY